MLLSPTLLCGWKSIQPQAVVMHDFTGVDFRDSGKIMGDFLA
jgi:hypothetical protein